MDQRVLVCFTHKQYVLLFPENPLNMELQKDFKIWHLECPLEILDLKELDKSYQLITRKERKKILEEINNEII